jgi:hypothetical protein
MGAVLPVSRAPGSPFFFRPCGKARASENDTCFDGVGGDSTASVVGPVTGPGGRLPMVPGERAVKGVVGKGGRPDIIYVSYPIVEPMRNISDLIDATLNANKTSKRDVKKDSPITASFILKYTKAFIQIFAINLPRIWPLIARVRSFTGKSPLNLRHATR